MPSLTQLEYIVAVDRLRHFGKAARHCHVSQPSLSMQLHKAEESLGVVIFDRDKKPIAPTSKGIPIIAQARVVLREHAKLIQISKEVATELSGRFHLGIIPTLAPYLVPLFIEKFATKYPKVELSIDELKTEDIIRNLKDDLLDAGLLATPLHEKSLYEQRLFYEPFYLYVQRSNHLASLVQVSETDLEKKEIWLLRDGHCFREQIINYCSLGQEQHSVLENVRFEGGSFETLRHLIKGGRGYTLFPYLFTMSLPQAEREFMVKSFKAPVPSREISLVYRRGDCNVDFFAALKDEIWGSIPKDLIEIDRNELVVLPLQGG